LPKAFFRHLDVGLLQLAFYERSLNIWHCYCKQWNS